MSNPLIFIGVPCYGTVAPELLEDWMRWLYHLGRRLPQYDFQLGIKTKSEQFRARNAIVDAAVQMGADWILMIDDDMIVNPLVTNGPTEEYGFIERLIAHDKDICGVLYYQRTGRCDPVLMTAVDEFGYRFLRDDEITHGLQRVDVAGGGCLLIKTKIFDRLKYPYFGPEYQHGTDIQLCRQALAKGFEVWADTSIEMGHVRDTRVIVTSRNRREFQLLDGMPGEMKKTFIAEDVYSRVIQDACAFTGYTDVDEMTVYAQAFMNDRKPSGLPDAEWYRQFPRERVARQIWYNTLNQSKRAMTEFILTSVDQHRRLKILDFGCGIGIPAVTFAEKGHDVTAMDIRGTGTLEFLKWRVDRHDLPIRVLETEGGVPDLGDDQYDVIVAMDCIEHIAEWQTVVAVLSAHLKPSGVLFSNNGILEDDQHPEHYPITPKTFIATCLDASLMPFNQITYTKQAARPHPKELAHA